jgi:hypothetical protein
MVFLTRIAKIFEAPNEGGLPSELVLPVASALPSAYAAGVFPLIKKRIVILS